MEHPRAFASLEEARPAVAYYRDPYFHLNRRHSTLGYRSPLQVEVDPLHHLPDLLVYYA